MAADANHGATGATHEPTHATDQRIEMFLGQLLRLGVALAAIVVITGGILYFKSAPSAIPNYHEFHGQPQEFTSVRQTVRGAAEFQPLAIIQLGLLLLIATPVARVFFSIIGFAMERDVLYICVTVVVLALLLHSLVGDILPHLHL
jgi:uncharacterized membrane protein